MNAPNLSRRHLTILKRNVNIECLRNHLLNNLSSGPLRTDVGKNVYRLGPVIIRPHKVCRARANWIPSGQNTPHRFYFVFRNRHVDDGLGLTSRTQPPPG